MTTKDMEAESVEIETNESQPENCLNCGAGLSGPYCSMCGQEAIHTVRPLRTFFAEGLADVLSFDFRYPRTIFKLIYPGDLTARYLAGQRIPYAPPLRVAFNLSILFLLAIALRLPDAGMITGDSDAANDVAFIAREYALVIAFAQILALPIWALLLKAGFKAQRPLYLNHFIFALHYHSAMALAGLLVILCSFISPLSVYATFGSLLFCVMAGPYLIFALHKVYEASWLRTLLLWGGYVFAYWALILSITSFLAGLSVGMSGN